VTDATLGAICDEAMRIWQQMKEHGSTLDERRSYLANVLRATWPKPHDRTEPWRYTCERCDDYGYEWRECPGDATCGLNPVTHQPRQRHSPHSYVAACWCAKGRAFIPQTQTETDELAMVGKTKRGFTRLGRS
jgi:hypothetical protein